MRILVTLFITLFSLSSLAKDITYVQCYGVKDSFAARSQLIKKSWAVNQYNQYLKLAGYWNENSYNATKENYFVVQNINSVPVSAGEVHQTLNEICRQTLAAKYSNDFTNNVTYFAANSSYGYEYPVLNELEAESINTQDIALSYHKILRYAFAASYAYSIEQGANGFAFYDDDAFQELMLTDGATGMQIIDTFVGASGIHGVAIKVPAIADKNLEEEIIISFKGTSNGGDVLQDIELMLANFVESDEDWQIDAYHFTQRILALYPPKNTALTQGYQVAKGTKKYNVVLTGHSLGGYTAIDAGVRTGVLTRVFSSPATRIIDKYIHAFANKMRFNNVINFIRETDPVATMSGRHNENMVYFPANNASYDPVASHYLTPFINDILKPLYQESNVKHASPTHVYITADTTIGAGLSQRMNYWRHFN